MASYLQNIFAYILEKNVQQGISWILNDQKAYSYWDSGFVGPIYIYETHTKKNHMFLHSSVKASQAMTDVKEVWIVIHNKSQTENQILWAWCLCIAGVYETCNHVIACLCKVD